MLARHQREQETLVADEERAHILKRTASTETLRPDRGKKAASEVIADSGLESAGESEYGTECSVSEEPSTHSDQLGADELATIEFAIVSANRRAR